jgi:hypothetical protein
MALAVFAGAAFALVALVPSIVDDVNLDFDTFNSSPDETGSPTEGPSGTTATAGPSPSPTPGLPAVNGSPFSLSTLENAWQAKGLTLFSGGGASGFSDLTLTPAAVRAERQGDTAALAVLIYPNSDALKEDWQISSGAAPVPQEGRSIPSHESIWWNQNAVVVLLSGSSAIAADAKEAFLAL